MHSRWACGPFLQRWHGRRETGRSESKDGKHMVWHILKKDWRLLWKLVLAVGAVNVASAATHFMLDHFGHNQALESLSQLFEPATLMARGLLTAAAVHQDAIPGLRQDWLVR